MKSPGRRNLAVAASQTESIEEHFPSAFNLAVGCGDRLTRKAPVTVTRAVLF